MQYNSYPLDEFNQLENVKSTENINKNNINNRRIPLYIDIILSPLLMDPYLLCYPKNKLNDNINSFPIILIYNIEYYDMFINFLNTSTIYKGFNISPVLKDKLIMPKIETNNQFGESHLPQNFDIIKFADITNSFDYPIYPMEIHEKIINDIKKEMNDDVNEFINRMNSWINMIMDLIVEFIKFKLKRISYYYYCDICRYPCFYFSDYLPEDFIIENSNIKIMINDSIKAFNELIEIVNIKPHKDKNSKQKENIINVICYEEEYNYMNYSFENEINGTFINCSNLKSLNKIMNEISDRNILIQNKNAKKASKIKFNITNNYLFELIISSIYIDKVFQFFINNNYFRFIKGICVLIDNKNDNNNFNINNNLLVIKKKYDDYIKDKHIEQNDIFLFLKNAKEDISFRNNQKYLVNNPVINYINYIQSFVKFHKDLSFYYTKYPSYSAQIFHDIILDFLKTIDIIKEQIDSSKSSKPKNIKNLSFSKKSKINKVLNIFKIIRQNISISDINYKKKMRGIDDIINNNLKKYEQDFSLFISDFNLWLNNSDNIFHEKLSYLTGSIMFTIDSNLSDNKEMYYENNEIDKTNNDLILYKEFVGNYIDVLIHENNKYKIITFPSFLICSTELTDIKNKDEDKYIIIYVIKYNLENKEQFLNILFDLNEETKVFQMFTFFRITDVKIKKNPQKVIVYMEPINKKECHEMKLKLDDAVVYNYNSNIMETIRYENVDKTNENINGDNLYITAADPLQNNEEINNQKITKYMQFFNNKYGTNLNKDMKSLSLEERYMKNLGLLILSKTNLENLIVLNLSKNNISDLSPLQNCNFPKLKKLYLESGLNTNPQEKIKDISPLMHVNFPDLFILNLRNNLISDISYLLFINFPNLIILDLSHNQIESIYVFSEVNFPNLETLDLSNNFITDISPFISSGKKKQTVKNVDSSSFLNSSNVSVFLSKSISNNENMKKNAILPSLKTLKIKNNKILIDEGYLMTIKALKNRGITIFK